MHNRQTDKHIMKKLSEAELIQLVLDSFEAERTGDTVKGAQLIHENFKKTGMQMTKAGPFYRIEGAEDIRSALENAYVVKGREFHIWRTAANKDTQTVFIELLEVQPEPQGNVSTWIYSLVCDIKNGKIAHTRHYGDPALMNSKLLPKEVERAVEGGETPRFESQIPDNSILRDLLALLEKARKLKDKDALDAVIGLSKTIENADDHNNFLILARDADEKIKKTEYHTHTSEQVSEAQLNIDKAAYGNFLEASKYLINDMSSWVWGQKHLTSDIFKPELFDKDDQLAWNNAKNSITKDDDGYPADGLKNLRKYLQKYHGKLITVRSAFYAKFSDTNPGIIDDGYTFRFYNLENELLVDGHADYKNQLRDSLLENVSKELPETIGDIKLVHQGMQENKIFKYEL